MFTPILSVCVLCVSIGVNVRLNGYASCTAELHLFGIGDPLMISACCCCLVMSSICAASFCSKISCLVAESHTNLWSALGNNSNILLLIVELSV